MFPHEEFRLAVFLERHPVATNDAIVGDDGLEDAAVVMGFVFVVRRKDDIAALISDEVFVVGRNQEVSVPAETSGAAIVGQIEFPALT